MYMQSPTKEQVTRRAPAGVRGTTGSQCAAVSHVASRKQLIGCNAMRCASSSMRYG